MESWIASAIAQSAVAVALSWLENTGEEVFEPNETTSAKPRKKRKTQGDQIREYLDTL
jgi:hypothetical protein